MIKLLSLIEETEDIIRKPGKGFLYVSPKEDIETYDRLYRKGKKYVAKKTTDRFGDPAYELFVPGQPGSGLIVTPDKLNILETEDNLPAEVPQVDRVESDVENIRQKFAECLDIDPSEVQVKKSEKASIEDYGNMAMSGDILISCPAVKRIGAEKVADLLNRFGFLEDIQINGESGQDLSALVFGSSRPNGGGGNPLGLMFGMNGVGDIAGGDVIITSKITEFRLVPFMARMGVNTANCEDAMEEYWRAIGGRAISDDEIMRYYQELAAALRPRLGMRRMGALPGRRQALPEVDGVQNEGLFGSDEVHIAKVRDKVQSMQNSAGVKLTLISNEKYPDEKGWMFYYLYAKKGNGDWKELSKYSIGAKKGMVDKKRAKDFLNRVKQLTFFNIPV